DIDFQCVGTFEQLNRNFELSLYRMIQELVQNVIKHASATHALVQLSMHDQHLSILVEDNGNGMKPDPAQAGIGLDSIRSRTKLMNGTLHIESAPGVGTSVYIEFDLANVKMIPDE